MVRVTGREVKIRKSKNQRLMRVTNQAVDQQALNSGNIASEET